MIREVKHGFAALLLLASAMMAAGDGFYIPIRGSAWRLGLGDLDGDGRNELVYGAYEGAVRAINPATGRLLWEAALDGFPFSVAAADINGDRRAEVFAATAAGTLYAFSPSGKLLWKHASGLPLYNIAVGRDTRGRAFIACGGIGRKVELLSAAGNKIAEYEVSQLVHRLAAADFDGDGASELLVIDRRTTAELLKPAADRLERIWRKDLKVPERMRNWENPGGNFYAFSLDTGDLDGDKRPEFVMGDTYFNKQAVLAARAVGGDPLWLSDVLPKAMAGSSEGYSADKWYEFYSTAWVRIGEVVASSPGPEVISVTGGNLRVFSARGELLLKAESALGFTDFVIDGRTLYLGSTPNGDDTIYRLPLDGKLAESFSSLDRRGLARTAGDNLARLREQAIAAKTGTTDSHRVYNWRMVNLTPAEASRRRAARLMEWFQSRFPYRNIKVVAGMQVIEPEPPLDKDGKPWNPLRWKTDSINGTMTVDQIVEAARLIESDRIPTVVGMGHSCMPFITLQTAEKMLKAAPNYLLGFISSEDEDFRLFPRYAKEYFGPLADLCARYGDKLCMTKDKNVWWMSTPANPETFKALFEGDRRRVLTANDEDSNSRTPELNLMARVGLRQAGLINGFEVSIHQDLFSFNRFHQWEYPRHGHPYLRLLVAHTVLGGSGHELRIPSTLERNGAIELTRLGRESIEIFAHLLGKGLVFAPAPDRMAGLSQVGIAMHQPPEKWLQDAHNGHRPEIWRPDPELERAVFPFNGCLWGMTPTAEHAIQRVLFHKARQFGYFLPPTPYGAVAIVPAEAELTKVAGVKEWWHTDGIAVWREGGPRLTGVEAAQAVRESYERAASQLPFRTTGDDVFFHSVRLADGRYRLYAIDPGWLDPRERRAVLHIQAAGEYEVRDLLSGDDVRVSAGKAALVVPAGSLRILEAVKRR